MTGHMNFPDAASNAAALVRDLGPSFQFMVVLDLLRGTHQDDDGTFCRCWLKEARKRLKNPDLLKVVDALDEATNALEDASNALEDARARSEQEHIDQAIAAAEQLANGGES